MNHKIKLLLPIGILLMLFSCQDRITKNPKITAIELKEHISYLASDSLMGRYPGDKGGILSAKYIHEQLSDYGLEPVGIGLQSFPVITGCQLGDSNALLYNNKKYTLDTDYLPIGFTSNTKATGKVTFVGYGFEINTDKLKWNDYLTLDVTGKWALILRDDPEPDNMMSEFIAYSNDRSKATLAKDKGAIGVLFVNGVNSSRKDKPKELSYDQNISNAGIPVISITRELANELLGESGSIEEIEAEVIKNQKSIGIATQQIITAQTDVIQKKVEANNVVFKIKAKGTTEAKQTVVLGAHFDHLGMGGESVNSRMPDTIAVHNGADDNASGVAGLIELAGYLQSKADTLKQDILVVAFDAEEMGTLGSKYFVNNLPHGHDSISVMINFDMIGRMKSDSVGITIGGTGTALEFDSILNATESIFNRNFSTDGYGPSDHAPFYSNNISVLFFTTGAHDEYHTPLDDIEKLDIKKEKKIMDYAAAIALNIASNDNKLTFKSTGSPRKGSARTRLKVTLGIIPDVSGIVKGGLGIDGVRKGGPADKGGIIKGDIITAINGNVVGNIYEYMFRMSKLKAETTAIVEVNRNGESKVMLIHL